MPVRRRDCFLLTGTLLFTISVCSCAYHSRPLFETIPTTRPMPELKQWKQRVPEEPAIEEVRIIIPKSSARPSPENYTNIPVTYKGKKPSILIGLPPRDEFIRSLSITTKGAPESPEGETRYATKYGQSKFYPGGEQFLERQLIFHGFDVRDRSKFEAILRDMRDSKLEKKKNADGELTPEAAAILTKLRKSYQSGLIKEEQYLQRAHEIRKLQKVISAGRKRSENEMIDVSEMIRAANGKAEFLMIITKLVVIEASARKFRIDGIEEVRHLVERQPGLKFGDMENGEMPRTITSPWFKAEFITKIVNVDTGSIVWMGSHEIDSRSAEPLELVIGFKREVANAAAVHKQISNHNLKIKQLYKNLEKTRARLISLYDSATRSVEFKNSEKKAEYENKLKTDIDRTRSEFGKLLKDYKQVSAQEPYGYDEPWEYKYTIFPPKLYPDLTVKKGDLQSKEKVAEHKDLLTNMVIKSLFNTIILIRTK